MSTYKSSKRDVSMRKLSRFSSPRRKGTNAKKNMSKFEFEEVTETKKQNVPPPYPFRKYLFETGQKALTDNPIEKERYVDALIEEELIRRSLSSEFDDNIEDIENGISIEDLIQKHRDPLKTFPTATLSFHILDLENVYIKNRFYTNKGPYYFYFFITNTLTRKVSKPIPTNNMKKIRFDTTIHFSVELPNERNYVENFLEVELWGFRTPEVHFLVGKNVLNLYDLAIIIRGFGSLKLWKEGIKGIQVASMNYEYCFAYGSYGYGHSTQLDNTDFPPYLTVRRSLFPRLKVESPDIPEKNFLTYFPKKLEIMNLNSLIMEKPTVGIVRNDGSQVSPDLLAKPKGIQALKVEFDRGEPYFIHVNLNIHQTEIEPEFRDAYGELLCITNRSERIFYLQQMINGRREDIEEDVYASALFGNLSDGDIDYILEAKEDPGSIIYPRPCNPKQHQQHDKHKKDEKVDKEVEMILGLLPAVCRTSGYLGKVFGLGDSDAEQVDEEVFPVDYNKGKIVFKKKHVCRNAWRWISVYLNPFALLYCLFIFAFPDLSQNKKKPSTKTQVVPEISLTLPSPSISTTDLHALWMPEQLLTREFDLMEEGKERDITTTRAQRDAAHILIINEEEMK